MIIGGAEEEISLQQLMAEVDQEVMAEFGNVGELDEERVTKAVHDKLNARGTYTSSLICSVKVF